jgi:hypothetical protein
MAHLIMLRLLVFCGLETAQGQGRLTATLPQLQPIFNPVELVRRVVGVLEKRQTGCSEPGYSVSGGTAFFE